MTKEQAIAALPALRAENEAAWAACKAFRTDGTPESRRAFAALRTRAGETNYAFREAEDIALGRA